MAGDFVQSPSQCECDQKCRQQTGHSKLHGQLAQAAFLPSEILTRRDQMLNALPADASRGLLLIAGIDTTWSAIGAALWHLASHPADRRRLADDPELIDVAVEEMLRAYAPVTMARIVAKDVDLAGRQLKAGDWVLLPFPAANRDPAMFEDADQVVLDRAVNRHAAFGLGIHRCLGSNLARMELNVAVQEWMARFPDFELADPDAVTWSAGQVRGPRRVPVRILDRS